jgi:hypothetical protein
MLFLPFGCFVSIQQTSLFYHPCLLICSENKTAEGQSLGSVFMGSIVSLASIRKKIFKEKLMDQKTKPEKASLKKSPS